MLRIGLLALALFAIHFLWIALVGIWRCEKMWEGRCINPPDVQEDLRWILVRFCQIVQGKGIRWWLDYGALLSAWRQGYLTPWDHDVDISYLAEDRELLAACAEEFARDGIELAPNLRFLRYKGRRLLDFYAFERRGRLRCCSDPAQRKGIYRYNDRLFEDFPAAWLDQPMWQIEFLGQTFNCPAFPERFLRRRYPSLYIHMRLCFPHRMTCLFCKDFWREAARIWISRYRPVIVSGQR